MSPITQALNFAKDYPKVCEYVRARYWAKSHKTENSCLAAKAKATQVWSELNGGEQEIASRAIQILNTGKRKY
jgi:hypothetical protein